MGTLDDDIRAYLQKSKGHFDRDEILQALAELAKAGGQVAAAVTVISGLATAGFIVNGIASRFGLRPEYIQGPMTRAMHNIWENWARLDQDQRQAYVKIAAWLRKSQFGF